MRLLHQNIKKESNSLSHGLDDDKNDSGKHGGKEPLISLSNGVNGATPPVSRGGGLPNGQSAAMAAAAAAAAAADDDGLKEEPPDFIETHCHWKDCNKEYNTPEELVKVSLGTV